MPLVNRTRLYAFFVICRRNKMKEYFQGKIGREKFFLRMIISLSILAISGLIMEIQNSFAFLGLLMFFAGLALYFNAIGLRLNDLNKPWTYFLLFFVPFANLYLLYLLLLKKGDKF